MKKFDVGDILYDSKYNVVAKLIDKCGTAIYIDELNNPDATIELDFDYCMYATQKQIEAVFNLPNLQIDYHKNFKL